MLYLSNKIGVRTFNDLYSAPPSTTVASLSHIVILLFLMLWILKPSPEITISKSPAYDPSTLFIPVTLLFESLSILTLTS